ncbi:MAG TPA: hypothetical protein PKE31_21075 [Pseudomonadota bacterium]|nr:hypothetical protein [Pseudomonadota bacterium]
MGLGSVRIEAKELCILYQAQDANGDWVLKKEEGNLSAWFNQNRRQDLPMLKEWLAVHQTKHPDAGDYAPKKECISADRTKGRTKDRTKGRTNQRK